MYQVQVMLSCTDINTFTERNIALLPYRGKMVTCKVCKQEVQVLYVGKPYPVQQVNKSKP